MKSNITKLSLLLNESGNEGKIDIVEESIADSIEEVVEEELFFSLPTNEIVKIIQKSDISNAETYSNIISRMCEVKKGEAALILNVVESKEATFEECVKIISSLKSSPICVRLGDLYEENEKMPEIDYEHEMSKLKQEIEEHKQQKEAEAEIKTKSQHIYYRINEDFKKRCNIKLSDVWYPDFSRKDITDMNRMFRGADLNGIDLSHWNTSNVTNMGCMFQEAQNIPESIGNWNTSNVTSMFYMFRGVQNIPESIGNWNTNNVTDLIDIVSYIQDIPESIRRKCPDGAFELSFW
jgi:surface protein